MVKNPGRITYEPIYEPKDDNCFEVYGIDLDEWKYFYPDAQEMTPKNIIKSLDKYVLIKAYVDANHAVNMENRRLNYVIIIYVNNSPIIY